MIAESLEPTVRVSSASSLFVFFALAFALMWICFFAVAFVPISAGSPLGGNLDLARGVRSGIGGARRYVPRRGPLGRDRAPS
jgi:pilus assembly protein TadC